MRLDDARALARELMDEHGLHGWQLVLDRARTRAGVCRPARREIGLSRVLTELHSEAEVRETVLHEVAHALVGAHHGHDAVWRARARAIGATGRRSVAPGAASAPAPWVGSCPAGHESRRYRRPERVASCSRCSTRFELSALVSWRLHGQVVPMPPRYAAELRRLLAPEGAGRQQREAGLPAARRRARARLEAVAGARADARLGAPTAVGAPPTGLVTLPSPLVERC